MSTEEQRALAAYRAMQRGGAKGGKATGEAKRRSPEHYANASRRAALARAAAKGLKLFEGFFADTRESAGRVQAANKTEAQQKLAAKLKRDRDQPLNIEEITT